MKNFKKIVSLCLMLCIGAVMMAALSGCKDNSETQSGVGEKKGQVRYLNFKPEQDAAWQKLAREYTKQTGIEVSVVTASQGSYEETLTAEIDKKNAPTLRGRNVGALSFALTNG